MSILVRLSPALTILCVAAACSKGGTASGSAGASGTSFTNGGGSACAKYLPPDVVATIIGTPTRPAKTLSAQSCTIERADDAGSITITLSNADAASFKAYQQYLSEPKPLAGVGDQATQTTLGIVSIKAPNMGCDIDAGGAPGSVKMDRATLSKQLGDICNRIYADAH